MEQKTEIDWSCKHNVLIRNPDGTYSRMDEPYFEAEQIVPGVWKILSSGDFSYCVAGEKMGVAIDTGYGAGNIRKYLEELTGVPVCHVINTHSHFDHTANNGYVEKAYMHPEAVGTATIPFESFDGVKFIQDYPRVGVEEGFIYDLGDKKLEIFHIPDHSRDGIAILDYADRVLFTGDEFMRFGKILNHATLREFYSYTEKLMAHAGEFDIVCAGGGVFDTSFISGFHQCAEHILAGNLGVPFDGDVHRPGALPDGPNGETVYDRMMPHFGDGGAGKMGQSEKTMYSKEYAGTKIVYPIEEMKE